MVRNVTDTIWRLGLKDQVHISGPAERLLSGRGSALNPDFSPDGKKIAFESSRMGSRDIRDIWICDSDGSNCIQLTDMHGYAGNPRWSPDGHYIVFQAVTKEDFEVYLLEYPGGTPRLLPTFPDGDKTQPRWSRDGQWIYFVSHWSEAIEGSIVVLSKMPFVGGKPTLVKTCYGQIFFVESPDRHFLYYTKFGSPGLWRMPLEGGDETLVLSAKVDVWNWALTRDGFYYINDNFKPNGRIEFFNFATHTTTPIFALERPVAFYSGLTLSPDGKWLLFSENELNESHIMLVKNFR